MVTTASEILPRVLKELVAAGSIGDASVEVQEGALVIMLKVRDQERPLGVARGGIRRFQSLDGAASVLQSYGIEKFSVNTANWVPKTVSRAMSKEASVE